MTIEIPASVFKDSIDRANKLAYRLSPECLMNDAIEVPYSVFEQGVKQANEKAYRHSKGLED